ncbi:hypothetical protein SAY86_004966 [Trapa natans]|uniref:Pentatricopeptide repeat-containing protein n=1 Tax=Trapa natans TaxID=22666 RepID=A0AAN7KTX8_TRANT|nr:hypothetical protein SAY86_004966 [Trapa natans]
MFQQRSNLFTGPPRMSTPVSVAGRPPRWVSRRRIFEQNLSELHKCRNLAHVKKFFAQILKSDRHLDPQMAAKLVSAFSLCHQMGLAVKASKAFETFWRMQINGVPADNFTYPFLLKGCSGESYLPLVQMIHTHVEKFGFFADIFVPNSLIDTYSKCGQLGISAAKKLFSVMEERDTVSWNTMISGLARYGELAEARRLFDEMPMRDTISWNAILDGYVKAGDMNAAFQLFEKMPERNVVSWSTMVSGYTKVGEIDMARMMFEMMPVKSVVPWTIIISGYAQKGLAKEAIMLYDQMEEAGVIIDYGTVISILAACAESGLLGLGQKVCTSIQRTGLKCTTSVLNALIDMYAKCGRSDEALRIFNRMPEKDAVSWNIIIHGLAAHGYAGKALELFDRMKQDNFEPDEVTFIGVLCACTHGGFVDRGLDYFLEMQKAYGIVPKIEHYGCLVDLLGRGGRLKEALDLIHSMPMEPNAIIWGTLLGACRVHDDSNTTEVLGRLIVLDNYDSGNFSTLSNICSAARDWDSAASVRLQMRSSGIQKPSGVSSIDVDDEVHEFTAFDMSHTESNDIYKIVDTIRMDLGETLLGYGSRHQ